MSTPVKIWATVGTIIAALVLAAAWVLLSENLSWGSGPVFMVSIIVGSLCFNAAYVIIRLVIWKA